MKLTKTPTSRKTAAQKPRKAAKKPQRTVHKRIMLHPFTVMVLLCAGVIICGSTFHSTAASYDVAASVLASVPTSPAVITQPSPDEHVTSKTVTVAGSCPQASYVKLYRNAVFMGAAQCSNQTFQIQTDLLPGVNSLQSRVFNVTNNEGPGSPAINVYYDVTTVSPPPAVPGAAGVPTTMWLENLERDEYRPGEVKSTSSHPTVTGFAPPYSDVTVTFYSDPVECKTQANDIGWWTCTLQQALPEGSHHVEVVAKTPEGKRLTLPIFEILVKLNIQNLLKPRPQYQPLLISTDYYFQTHYVGQPFHWNMAFENGTGPYVLTIDWGDGNDSKITRQDAGSFPLTHAYVNAKTYTVFMTVTDRNGETAMVQLSAMVKDQPIGPASITNSGPVASVLTSIKRYLWVVWPVYIAIVLMVLSYWLGEQEMYQRLVKRRSIRAGKGR